MPHIKSNIDLEKSFGKFSTSYLSESKQLEMKIAKDVKIINRLFFVLIAVLCSGITGIIITSLYLTGKI